MLLFKNISKKYFDNDFALQDIDLEIDSGEFVLLTGPSGSGKTTLMRLLTREFTPDEGEILFHDIDITTIPSSKIHEHRRKIGVVFQDYKLMQDLTVWENIALPLNILNKSEDEIEKRVTDLLKLIKLTDKAFHFPKQLSGGEAQRVSLARAISTGPVLLFADEPTGNLDMENTMEIINLIKTINDLGTTVIFATHDQSAIEELKNKRHVVIEKGKVKADSKPTKKENTKKKESEEKPEKSEKKNSQEKKDKKPSKENIDNNKEEKK